MGVFRIAVDTRKYNEKKKTLYEATVKVLNYFVFTCDPQSKNHNLQSVSGETEV